MGSGEPSSWPTTWPTGWPCTERIVMRGSLQDRLRAVMIELAIASCDRDYELADGEVSQLLLAKGLIEDQTEPGYAGCRYQPTKELLDWIGEGMWPAARGRH